MGKFFQHIINLILLYDCMHRSFLYGVSVYFIYCVFNASLLPNVDDNCNWSNIVVYSEYDNVYNKEMGCYNKHTHGDILFTLKHIPAASFNCAHFTSMIIIFLVSKPFLSFLKKYVTFFGAY